MPIVAEKTPQDDEASAPLGGAVDWSLAAKAGIKLARGGPAMSRYTAETATAELAEASERAELPVREVTGLADGLPVPAADVLDRAGWITAASRSMAHLTGADPDGSGNLIVGKPAGLQAGAMLAYLSSAILGQYDPFTGEHGTLLLVTPNIVSVERSLRLNPSDFRLWVCLHEVTHRVQFSSSPWLAEYMKESVETLGATVDESMTDVVGRLAAELRSRKEPDSSDGATAGGIIGLLRASQAEPQRDALDRMLVLGTLLEGHADHVMDAVGPAVVPSVSTIRAPSTSVGSASPTPCSGSSRCCSAWTPRWRSTYVARPSSTRWFSRSAWSSSTPSGPGPRPCRCSTRSTIPTRG